MDSCPERFHGSLAERGVTLGQRLRRWPNVTLRLELDQWSGAACDGLDKANQTRQQSQYQELTGSESR